MDKSGANLAGLTEINQELSPEQQITIRQVKYLNNMVEQDHRGIKRITKPMLGFKSFASAENILAGMEALLKPDFYPNFNKQSVDIIVL